MSKDKPSLSQQAKLLRETMGFSQEQFAKALGVKRLAVLMWEKKIGGYEPSVESRIRLAKLAHEAAGTRPSHAALLLSCAGQFWREAGVHDDALRVLVPELKQSFARFEKRLKERQEPQEVGQVTQLPLLEDFAGLHYQALASRIRKAIREGADSYVSFPSAAVPLPHATICVRAPDDYMRPIFHAGDFLAVDFSSGGDDSVGGALSLARKLEERMFVPLGDRTVFAIYYDRPDKPPRWRGRGGLHARSMTGQIDDAGKRTGRILLSTEMGLNIMAAAKALGGRVRAELPEVEESSSLIYPTDPGISVIGQVVAWIGSTWKPRSDSERQSSFIHELGIIGGYTNDLTLAAALSKGRPRPRKK
jgi:transcriptional regulator with XRE-family HTH domain